MKRPDGLIRCLWSSSKSRSSRSPPQPRKRSVIPIQLKRRSARSWAQLNEVLADGEPGYEKGTGKLKIGNGVAHWNDLPYFGEGAPEDAGGDDGEGTLPPGVPTFKGIYDPTAQYKAGDLVKSAGVPWIATADNQGELPALPLSPVEPKSTLASTCRELNTKPYADPYLPFWGDNWDHDNRYLEILPGGSLHIVVDATANVGKVVVYDSRDSTSPSYGEVKYDSQAEGIPAAGPHEVHNLQPGRYVVENYLVNTAIPQGTNGYRPKLIITGANGAVIWGVDISDAPVPSWTPLIDPS